MKNIIVIPGIVSLLFLSSCVTLNEFPIEVFKPAEVTLSPQIKNLTLVSRNLKYSNDTLQHYYSKNFKKIKDITPINIDSLCVQACFDSLSSKLESQKYFNKITVLTVTSFPIQYSKNIYSPSKSLIQKISADTNADALVLLDMFSSFYSVFPNPENGHSIAKVITASIWTIYDASKTQIINHASLIDTLYWDGLDDQKNYSASKIPNKKAALKIASGTVGINFSKKIVPNWTKVYRNTISCDQQDFKKAAELAKANNWAEAAALWENYTESSNKKYKMMALFNLALSSEMNGNIDEAIELINKALEVSSSPFRATGIENIRKYASVLAKRKIDLNKISSMNYEL